MCGNKKIVSVIILFFLFSLIHAHAASDGIPAKSFRLGMDIEPGFKFVGPSGFHMKMGISLKFDDKFSVIPYFAMYPDEQEEEYSYYNDYYPYNTYPGMDHSGDTYTSSEVVVDAGVIFRFEFPKKIVRKSTMYEYDVVSRRFLHYYYYTRFRPYFQFILGSFMGAGGGFNYYFNSNASFGLGMDIGYNLAAEEGFGIIPKAIVTVAM